MLGSALDYPTSGEDGAGAVLVGGALAFLTAGSALAGLLFLPALGVALLCHLVVRGYYVRVLRLTAGDPGAEAPAFDRWGDLLVDGVKANVVMVAYTLPALVLVGVAAGGELASAAGRPGVPVGALRTLTGLSVLFLLLYLLAAAYLLPAAVTSFAHAGRLRAAVHPRVLRGALSEDYAVAWVVSVLFQLVALPLAFLLQTLLVGFVVQFFVGVATRHMWGRGLGTALDLGPATGETVPGEPDSGVGPTDPANPESPATATAAARPPEADRPTDETPAARDGGAESGTTPAGGDGRDRADDRSPGRREE